MLTEAGVRIAARLLAGDLGKGEVTFEGEQLMRNGQAVRPEIIWVRDDADAGQVSAGIRLGTSHQIEENTTMKMHFAELPAEVLVHADPKVAGRAERSLRAAAQATSDWQAAVQKMAWPGDSPGKFAKLPKDPLTDGR